MSTLTVHPVAARFPLLDGDELQALADDIARNGLLEPLVVTGDGELLDGRNRLAACELAGVQPDFRTYEGDDPTAFVVSANLHRRHLTIGQRAMLALELLPQEGRSAHKRARDQAARQVGVSGRAVQQAKRLADEAPDLAEKVTAGDLALDRADRLHRSRVRAVTPALADPSISDLTSGRVTLLHGDFRQRLADLPNGSVDLIVTDPPYERAALPLWSDLGSLAGRVLGPRGLLVAWTGKLFLPEVMQRLDAAGLRYGWMFSLSLPGSNSRILARHMLQEWKPVLAYSTGSWPVGEWAGDTLESPAPNKSAFEWAQSVEPARKLIERFSPPDGIVVDPMLGVGSFGVAAVQAGRRFVGVELDAGRYRQAVEAIGATND